MASPASAASGSSSRTSTTATSPAPAASATAFGTVISEVAAAAVRPSSASGVSRCTAVIAAISTQGRPAPIAALAARLAALIADPAALPAAAAAASSLAQPDAARRLADLVLSLVRPPTEQVSPR